MKRHFRMAKHLFNSNAYITADNLIRFEYKLLDTFYYRDAKKQYAIYSLCWYVTTNRAYYDWCEAFSKAAPEKLLDYMCRHNGSGSVHENLDAANKYLTRYCGLVIIPDLP